MSDEQFWSHVDQSGGPDECWPWLQYVSIYGYGVSNRRPAHRIAYQLAVGPIPKGHVLDHTCHNSDSSCAGGDSCKHRSCVNPAHLEPVLQAVNAQRGRTGEHNSKRTHCKRGHEFTPENTYVQRGKDRACRTCKSELDRAYKAKRRRAA